MEKKSMYQTIQETSRTTGLSQYYLRQGVKNGTIPHVKQRSRSERNNRMGRTKKKKTVKSGPLVEVVCYSQAFPRDTKQERAVKTKSSSEARKRLNDIASWKKLERLICCNFMKGCYFVTLT